MKNDGILMSGGRSFTSKDVAVINQVIGSGLYTRRSQIARTVCDLIKWKTRSGTPALREAFKALSKLDQRGLIKLPPATNVRKKNQVKVPDHLPEGDHPGREVSIQSPDFSDLQIEAVDKSRSELFNSLLDRYHPIGHTMLVGRRIRYLVRWRGYLVAAAAFGPAAYRLRDRDKWIGWTEVQRKERLNLIVNNTRFLILPWINAPHLASHLLSRLANRVSEDWVEKYGYAPVMLETFVDKIYKGTCYRAANWQEIGETTGRGRYSINQEVTTTVKSIFVLPLDRKKTLELKTDTAPKVRERKRQDSLARATISREIQVFMRKAREIERCAEKIFQGERLPVIWKTEHYRKCGNPRCKCAVKGERHGPYHYLIYANHQQKRKKVLVKRADPNHIELAAQYQEMAAALKRIEEICKDLPRQAREMVDARSYYVAD